MTPDARDYVRSVAERCKNGALRIGDLTTMAHAILAFVPPGKIDPPFRFEIGAFNLEDERMPVTMPAFPVSLHQAEQCAWALLVEVARLRAAIATTTTPATSAAEGTK